MEPLRIKLDLEIYDAQCIITALLKAGVGYSRLAQKIEAKIAEDTAEHCREKAEADAAAKRKAEREAREAVWAATGKAVS